MWFMRFTIATLAFLIFLFAGQDGIAATNEAARKDVSGKDAANKVAAGKDATSKDAASNGTTSKLKQSVEAQCEAAVVSLKKNADDANALSVIRKNLKSPIAYDRAAAVVAAREAGKNAKQLVPQLIAGLTDESATVRGESATTLGAIGPDAKAAVKALKVASTSPHPPEQGAGCCMVQRDMWVQAAAQKALKQIGSK